MRLTVTMEMPCLTDISSYLFGGPYETDRGHGNALSDRYNYYIMVRYYDYRLLD